MPAGAMANNAEINTARKGGQLYRQFMIALKAAKFRKHCLEKLKK
jgi:hypothetical protein